MEMSSVKKTLIDSSMMHKFTYNINIGVVAKKISKV